MEEMYSQICNYLQECVNNDIYTEDEAQEIADIAYNRYMVEGNAFNKYANKLQDKVNKLNDENDTLSAVLGDRAEPIIKKRSEILNQKKSNFERDSDYGIEYYDRKGSKHSGSKRNLQREIKDEWLYRKGNRGERPEDKYKKDRYLVAQNALKDDKDRKKIDVKSMNDKVKKKVAEVKQNS